MIDGARPLVSIITSTFNSSRYIEQTYKSICMQSHGNWEWLITDDCSTDSTREKIKGFSASDPRVRVFEMEQNVGAGAARNNSISAARGQYIAFLDSDDLWLPDKLSRQLEFMNDDIVFSFTGFEVISAGGQSTGRFVDTGNRLRAYNYNDMLKKRATLGCSTVMLRRSAVCDMRMPVYRTGQDYGYWLNILKNGASAYLISEPLTKYRISPNSISRNKFKKALRQWSIYRQQERLGMFYAIDCFLNYAIRALIR